MLRFVQNDKNSVCSNFAASNRCIMYKHYRKIDRQFANKIVINDAIFSAANFYKNKL